MRTKTRPWRYRTETYRGYRLYMMSDGTCQITHVTPDVICTEDSGTEARVLIDQWVEVSSH